MKILIGILILLFMLTTIGFSGVAFAEATCSETFLSESYVYQGEESEVQYTGNRTGYFLERRQQNRDDRSWNEFSSERNENEFHYNENF